MTDSKRDGEFCESLCVKRDHDPPFATLSDDQGKIDFDDEFDGVDNGNDDSDDDDDDNGPEQSAGPLVGRCLFHIVKFPSKFTLKVNRPLRKIP